MTDDASLRFADGPTTQAEIVIAAPVDEVWVLVTDIALPARFSTELLGAEWIEGTTGPAEGARFVGRSHHDAIGDWETTSIVIACDPQRRFEWAVGDVEQPGATWAYTLAPEGDGTRLTQSMRIGPGPSGLTPALEAMPDKESRILHHRLREHRANMERNLEGIRSLAEHPTT